MPVVAKPICSRLALHQKELGKFRAHRQPEKLKKKQRKKFAL